ncbi:MAG TPA: PilZ domain-containing protein [Caulobacteraceae bacterium]|nr:PilZ domain-containing protein [Caulobacteraceae bacterium]
MVVNVRSRPLPPGAGQERRRSTRRPVTLGGRLFFGLAGLSIDCVIRDLSDHGARVAVPQANWRGSREIRLLSLREGRIYSGTVIWQKGRYLGLDFTHVADAINDQTPELAPIHAAWQASLANP